jgi:adenine-specific DNA methylase
VPDEPLPEERAQGSSGFRTILYGLTRWGDLFNARQKLALITFAEKVRGVYGGIRGSEFGIREEDREEFARAVTTYLALAVSRMADFESTLCRWHPQWEFIPNTFARQALPMAWDYAELVPLSPVLTGTFASMFGQVIEVLNHLTGIPPEEAEP